MLIKKKKLSSQCFALLFCSFSLKILSTITWSSSCLNPINKSNLCLELNLLSCYSLHLPHFITGSHVLQYFVGERMFQCLLFSVCGWLELVFKKMSHPLDVYKDIGICFSNEENSSAASRSQKKPQQNQFYANRPVFRLSLRMRSHRH